MPGVIYDVLGVSPKSLSERRDDWKKVAQGLVPHRQVPEGSQRTSTRPPRSWRRVGLEPAKYKDLMKGTLLPRPGGQPRSASREGETLESMYFSDKVEDEFQVKNDVYKKPVDYEELLDSSLVTELAARSRGNMANPSTKTRQTP